MFKIIAVIIGAFAVVYCIIAAGYAVVAVAAIIASIYRWVKRIALKYKTLNA